MMQSFVNCTPYVMLLQWLNEGGSDGWGQVLLMHKERMCKYCFHLKTTV